MARIGILALLMASLLGACSSPSAGATMSPSVGVSASPSAIVSPLPSAAAFPSEVAGLPVISVADADELLRSGKLDGQAVAVAGYFDSSPHPARIRGGTSARSRAGVGSWPSPTPAPALSCASRRATMARAAASHPERTWRPSS